MDVEVPCDPADFNLKLQSDISHRSSGAMRDSADLEDVNVEMNVENSFWETGQRQLDCLVKPWRASENMMDCVYAREYSKFPRRRQMTQLVDESFVRSSEWSLKDYLNAPTTISTISIAISRDGEYLATSHGDHTVKVFNFRSAEINRVLRGHPRTPWTVKFHPLDSNILASGCLGGEVRVWNIALGLCTNYVTMDNSIISIAFHPQGSCIAISSGYLLSMWDYRHMMAPQHGGYAPGQDPITEWRSVRHPRNIRAVMFHPSGEFLFVAAPDSPKAATNSTANILRLYAIPCVILAPDPTDPSGVDDTLDLWTMPTVIPELHLYSDGGLDVSQDGQFLLSCSMLAVRPRDAGRDSDTDSDAQSDTAVANDETRSSSNRNNNNNNNSKQQHENNNRAASMTSARTPSSGSGSGSGSGATAAISNRNQQQTPNSGQQQGPQHRSWISSWLPHSLAGLLGDGNNNHHHGDPGNNATPARTRSGSSNSHNNDQHAMNEDGGHYFGGGGGGAGGRQRGESNAGEDEPFVVDTKKGESVPEGWLYKEYVCIFQLTYDLTKPKLLQYKPLTMNLMKAVTSTKFSPSSAFALIGFGVRHDGRVVDHPSGDITCEILQWNRSGTEMISAGRVLNSEDEVNIAQWHAVAGTGIVYGTKRGIVKVCLANYQRLTHIDPDGVADTSEKAQQQQSTKCAACGLRLHGDPR